MARGSLKAAKGPALFALMVLAGAALGWLVIPNPPPTPYVPKRSARDAPTSLAGGSVRYAGDATFSHEVLSSPVPVLVDFYADWCGPCRELDPVIEELARETPQAKFVKVNIDRETALAVRYGVSAIPRLMVFRGGQVVADHTGTADKTRIKAMLGL